MCIHKADIQTTEFIFLQHRNKKRMRRIIAKRREKTRQRKERKAKKKKSLKIKCLMENMKNETLHLVFSFNFKHEAAWHTAIYLSHTHL